MENDNKYVRPGEGKFKSYIGTAVKTGVVLGALTLAALGIYRGLKSPEVESIPKKEVKVENIESKKSPKQETNIKTVSKKNELIDYVKKIDITNNDYLTGKDISEAVQNTGEGKGLLTLLKKQGMSDESRIKFESRGRSYFGNEVYDLEVTDSRGYVILYTSSTDDPEKDYDDIDLLKKWRANKSATLEKKVQ